MSDLASTRQGCLEGYCKLRIEPLPKGAMHTNGGCRCLRDIATAKRIEIERKLAADRAEIERLQRTIIVQAATRRKDEQELLKEIERWKHSVQFMGERLRAEIEKLQTERLSTNLLLQEAIYPMSEERRPRWRQMVKETLSV